MGFRFRRSIRLLPGVRVNLGKRGASVSVGGRGAHVTIGPAGTRTTVGVPGTGLSYTHLEGPRRTAGVPPAVQDRAPRGRRVLLVLACAALLLAWILATR